MPSLHTGKGFTEMKAAGFLPFILLFCACEDDLLVRVECRTGQVRFCDYEGNTFEDPTQIREHLGACQTGTSICSRHGAWAACTGAIAPAEEICDGLDNNCNGSIDEEYPEKHQLCGFVENVSYGVGVCSPGVMTCDNGGLRCDGHTGPSDEICDGLDNDCNGSVDEGIANSTAIVCYEGPEGTMGVGECRGGIRYCTDGGFDGPCDRQIVPREEICDSLDNDCDGEVDEGFDNRGVDLVFVLDISGSFDDEIESMIQGIAPLLDDPITSQFRFGLIVVGTASMGELRPLHMYSKMVSDFVPADEFLEVLEAGRIIPSAGQEPTIDTMLWTMNGSYPFTWRPNSQKVIITMTDEPAQTITGTGCPQVAMIASEQQYQLFVFALQEHHNTFLQCVDNNADRLYTPVADSNVIFDQIKSIFEDLCLGN